MNHEVIKRAIKHYGHNQELNQTIEELGELIVQVSKYKRGLFNRDAIISEMADVLICFEYLKAILVIQEDELNNAIDYKQDRLVDRMDHGLK